MSLHQDIQYLEKVGHLFKNFKRKGNYLWNLSCPLCGDSSTKKFKARGYIFRGEVDGLVYKCHKCGESIPFGILLKNIDSTVYKDYIVETYLEKGEEPKKFIKHEKTNLNKNTLNIVKNVIKASKPIELFKNCQTIQSLKSNHPAKVYIESRKIPEKFWKELYWTDDFPSVANEVCQDHNFSLVKEGRIIIPFLNSKNEIIAIQGRSLEPDAYIRYITIKAYEDAPRIFGLNRLDTKIINRVYCVEGPFDSLFLPNCIAMAGSDIPKGFPHNKLVIIYDNEPKKQGTVNKITKAIESGYTVFIWPENINEKDINLMIINGYKPDKIRKIIDSNLYSGLTAKLKLQHWSNPKGNSKIIFKKQNA